MASKWREYFVADTPDDGLWVADSDLKLWAMLDDWNQENTPRITVVPKDALDEALELIGELEDFLALIPKNQGSEVYEWVPEIEEILLKIKAFKDSENESTTTEIKGELK